MSPDNLKGKLNNNKFFNPEVSNKNLASKSSNEETDLVAGEQSEETAEQVKRLKTN